MLAALILGMLFIFCCSVGGSFSYFRLFSAFLSRMIAGLFRLILMPGRKIGQKIEKMVRKALKKKIKQVRMVIVKK